MTFDHTRRACYAGYVTQAIVNNLAPLLFIVFQTRYAISYEMLGRLILLNFAVQLLTDFVAIQFVDRTGYRAPLVAAHALCALGLALLAVLPSVLPAPYLGLCFAITVYAIGGGLLEVLVSPVVEALPSPAQGKAAAMSLLHSFYCWGQVVVVLGTTFLLARLGQNAWQVVPLVWALVPLGNLFNLLRVPMPETVAAEHRASLQQLLGLPVFRVALALMLCAAATELTLSQWSSLFAEQGLNLPKVWGDIAGPCLFAVLMGIGRIIYGLQGEKIPLLPAMIACGALATACYLTAALSRHAVWSLAGCAVCGLAVSLLWPGTFSLAAARFPAGGAAMFGLLALFGDAGAGLGPWLAGAVADEVSRSPESWRVLLQLLPQTGNMGLRAGVLVGSIFPLGVIAMAIAYGVWARRRTAPTTSQTRVR